MDWLGFEWPMFWAYPSKDILVNSPILPLQGTSQNKKNNTKQRIIIICYLLNGNINAMLEPILPKYLVKR